MRRAYLAKATVRDINATADLIVTRTGTPPTKCRAHPRTIEVLLRTLPGWRPSLEEPRGYQMLQIMGTRVEPDATMPADVVELTAS